MKKFLIAFGVLATVSGIAAGWFWNDYQTYLKTPLSITEDQVFEVEKGSRFNKVLSKLKEKDGTVNDLYLKLYARHSKLASKIKAGEYMLKQGMTPVAFLKLITSGRSISYNFTIVEGSTFKQLKASLLAAKNLKNDIADLSDTELLKKLGIEYKHTEGVFLAETYSYERNSNISTLLSRAHKMLKQELDAKWQERQKDLPYKNPYESLIMASIVEKETGRAVERPIISGVFVRRLEKRMRLQTDPTVIYGMGDAYKGNIRRSDLRKPTPYNTYVIPALPPTPIAMVGREAIHAALNPTDGKALYFVAKGDGSHYFSATLREHNNAVKKYQLTRRKDYRSSP
ncbi:endolytic transglycosylase MltG [Neptuniibacter sp.]|uniref:endolytic transglycosylase MltG n=1 Tax=Neptuniibacter sp. TaxID=1962643 RepID=UPI002622DA3D|nr:endolytic transglycosylase MltG [Neptuniibacter sp.]MCP4595779.1 endolytic transglycosylase MltG [Neptuniibacter sp.]